jgi:DNA-binding response OmpR family regulator
MQTNPTSGSTKKILVVDDNPVVLKAMYFFLRNHGYDVVMAESGSDTLTSLRRDKPDLILLDLDLPDTGNVSNAMRDGFIIMDWARRTGAAENIPVIIISALDPEEYKSRALAAGIAIFFRKPVDNDKLLAAIHATLHDAPVRPAA